MRQKLPNRRASDTFEFTHEDQNYICLFSLYPDGRLAEVFLDLELPGKPGSPLDLMAKDMATLLSIALQHGIPEDEIMTSLSQEKDGTMRGPLGVALAIIKGMRGDDWSPMAAVPGLAPAGSGGAAAEAVAS